jgi:hypothetical protein
MAFFDIHDAIPVDPKFLDYVFEGVELFNANSWSKVKTDGVKYVYRVIYPTDNITQLQYTGNDNIKTIYQPVLMYVCGVLHSNITGLTSTMEDNNIVGELVFECVSNSAPGKVFLCVFLKSLVSPSGVLGGSYMDDFIKYILTAQIGTPDYRSSVALRFGNFLDQRVSTKGEQNCFVYKDDIDTVIILTTPYPIITQESVDILNILDTNTELFSISAPNEAAALANELSSKEKNKNVSNVPDDIYIDCKPTGSSLEDVTTYSIPIDSDFTKDIQKMDFIKTSMNFFVFIIGLIIVYTAVPGTFKMLIIDKVNRLQSGDNQTRIRRVRSAEMWIFLGFAAAIIACFINPEKKSYATIYALYLGIFYGLSFSIIQFKKAGNNVDFLGTIKSNTIAYDLTPGKPIEPSEIVNQLFDMGTLFVSIIVFVVMKAGIPVVFLCLLLWGVFSILNYHRVMILSDEDFKNYCMPVVKYVIPICVPAFIFFVS